MVELDDWQRLFGALLSWAGCMIIWAALVWALSGWWVRPEVRDRVARRINKDVLAGKPIDWEGVCEEHPSTISLLISASTAPHGAMFKAVTIPGLSMVCIGLAIWTSAGNSSFLATAGSVAAASCLPLGIAMVVHTPMDTLTITTQAGLRSLSSAEEIYNQLWMSIHINGFVLAVIVPAVPSTISAVVDLVLFFTANI